MHKVLLIGPLPDPVTGLSIANKTVMDNLGKYSDDFQIESVNMSYDRLGEIGKFSVSKALFFLKLYKNIFRIPKFDIIYITPGQTFFGVVKYSLFIYFAKLLRKTIIIHIHGNGLSNIYDSSSSWKKLIMKSILKKADKGIVLSESLKGNMTPFIEDENIFILYNFVEDLLFENSDEHIFHDDHLRILYLSNLMPEKGIFDLLDALKKLEKKNIKFTAQIAGAIDKEHKTEILQKIENLSENVEYLGVVKGKEKKKAFMDSNIFVFPTYYPMEGQPIAILEAMGTGNIILTTNHAGIKDIIADSKNGYFIEKNSPESILEKLLDISNNISIYKNIYDNNRYEAQEKYTVKKFINNFVKILEE